MEYDKRFKISPEQILDTIKNNIKVAIECKEQLDKEIKSLKRKLKELDSEDIIEELLK